MHDLEPATRVLSELVAGVRDEQLHAPTPCAPWSLGDLLDHVDGLSWAFTAAATKTPTGDQVPSVDAAHLGAGWRARIPERLAELARAWREEAAWRGMTRAGGVDMPAEIAARVALNEVIVHGWDIAAASGQRFRGEPRLTQAAYEFAQAAVVEHPKGAPGLFGPPVPVPDDAPLLARLLGLTGRDPAWRLGVGVS